MEDEQDPDVDDVFDMSDRSTSSSSGASLTDLPKSIFQEHKPFVLELHDLRRTNQTSNAGSTEPKKKLRKKKKTKELKPKPISSSSPSEASLKAGAEAAKEQFYDAHESYHGLPQNQAAPAASAVAPAAGAVLQDSDLDAATKIVVAAAAAATPPKAPATTPISKPVTPTE